MGVQDHIKKVGVVGAGTMGQGIAQVAAMAGYQVVLYDINKDTLKKAQAAILLNLQKGIERGKVSEELMDQTLDRLTLTDQIMEVTADLIIEAILEDLAVKQQLFADLEAINSPQTYYTSNTSSIPVTQIAAGLNNPARFAGLHFFNPAHIMKLVEIISGSATDPELIQLLQDFTVSLGKTGVVANDSPGFIVNRVARHYYVESLKILEEGVSDVQGIDTLLEATGFPLGPFRLMDLIGIDTNYAVTKSMYRAFHNDPKFRPNRIQQQKVDAGHLGRKSGKGFYEYSQ
ncbi:MAG: 3-hydroxyacyl-CoA dehydrogenase NAD-binding domain-containing protein [Cyclobacteriaceae bacterium]|nr:3-hydroxyacyl-CoA dehydrogenase NAD-binding domain-containing protein [Cyclobacteriaceae bacterium]